MADFTFDHVDVKEALTSALKDQLPKMGYPTVKVIKADPTTASEIPCIGINRVDDSESETSIANGEGNYYDADTQTYYEVYGTYFSESMELRIWHTNADERDKLYKAMKAILLAQRQSLVQQGLLNITLRGGKDEQEVSGEQAPIAIYWSTITMSFLNPLDVYFTKVAQPISAVPVNGVLQGGSQ
jgi:hypothetical protein